MPKVLQRAGIPHSTWRRWATGGAYTSTKLQRLIDALTAILEENNG
jgi:hypothetical protein